MKIQKYLSSILTFLFLLTVVLTACTPASSEPTQVQTEPPAASVTEPVAGERRLILATTTSTQDSGLLEAILPDFEAQTGVSVDVVAVGTGQALQLGVDGNADVLLVHARAHAKMSL